MLGIQNMREQCFLTAAVHHTKRLTRPFASVPGWSEQTGTQSVFGFQRRQMARFAMRRPVLRHRSMQFEHIRQLIAHILL